MKRILLTCLAVLMFSAAKAERGCELNFTVIPPEAGEELPASVVEKLTGRLSTLLSATGVSVSSDDLQFFLTGRFDNAFFEKTTGPDQRDVINTTLTLYIGDADGQKIFSSMTMDLKGVGKSEAQAYIKAMSTLTARRKDVVAFIEEGKAKIIDYFNKNYNTYLTKARTAMKQRNYDEALYYSLQIPECCVGFPQAQALALEIYDHQVDYIGQTLLARAKAAFGVNPTDKGAAEAFLYIMQIDPSAACYKEAVAYGDKMQKDVKTQWEFENIQKYKDELALRRRQLDNQAKIEQARIESARAIGVAWAKSQPTTRVYHHWY